MSGARFARLSVHYPLLLSKAQQYLTRLTLPRTYQQQVDQQNQGSVAKE